MSSMPQPAPFDPAQVVLGVDTHKDIHVAAILDGLGVLLATDAFPTTAEGYAQPPQRIFGSILDLRMIPWMRDCPRRCLRRYDASSGPFSVPELTRRCVWGAQLLGWVQGFGTVRRAGVEGTGSYGAALSRHLQAEAVTVIEVNRADRGNRRRRGKTDTIEAEAAARAVLSGRATAIAKSGDGPVEMLRMFKLAKGSAIRSRGQATNQLKAVLVGADPAMRESMNNLRNPALFRRCAQFNGPDPSDPATAATFTLRLLARQLALTRRFVLSPRRLLG